MNALIAGLCAALAVNRLSKGEDLLGAMWTFNAVVNALLFLK